GGTDQANLSFKILNDLLKSQLTSSLNFNLVLGAGYKYHRDIEALVVLPNVKAFYNINNVGELMLQNDFLLTSPGTAYFEGLYIRIPSIAFFQNQSQKQVFDNFFYTFDYNEIDSIPELMIQTYNSD